MNKYIGPKEFYSTTFKIAIPLAVQMLLGSCMAIIDSMMVSRIGMVTAVGNASQLLTLNDGILWGVVSGIAMFAAQFYGAKQEINLKKTFGLSIMICVLNSIIWIFVALVFGKIFLYFYLPDLAVLEHSVQYLRIVVFSILFLSINSSYSVMYRSMHKANLTLYVSVFGAILNVVLNALFIFGLSMGVAGAGFATVIAQAVTTAIYTIHAVKTKQPFIGTIGEMFKIDLKFIKPIILKMLPLMVNEMLFGFGMTMFVKAYGALGTQSMDAYYVSNQIFNLFMFAVHGYGSAVSILIGTRLGEGKIEQAKKESNYQLGLGFIISCVIVVFMITFSKSFVQLFGIKDPITYSLAVNMLYVLSIKVFLRMFNFMMFSTLRAGGDANILNILDSGIVYFVGLPIAFGSVHLLKVNSIVIVLLLCQLEQVVRMVLTLIRYNSAKWATDLTKLVKE